MRFLTTVFIVLIGFSLPAFAGESDAKITVTGQGQVATAPDMATVTLGVSAFDAEASKALKQNSALMTKVFETIKAAGVEPKDIQTSQLNLNPRWERNNGNNQPKIIGYDAVNTVVVRVRDLTDLGIVLDNIATAGANRIQGISFGVQNPRPLVDEARKRAVADAKSKAELYTDAAGVKLGAVLSISETGGGGRPRQMARGMEMAMADAVPIAEGEVSLSAQVTIVYAID